MTELNEALILAGIGFGYVFLFLGCLILLLIISSRIFSLFTDKEDELREAASVATLEHHNKRTK